MNDRRAYLSQKVNATPEPQILTFNLGPNVDLESEGVKFWRELLAGKINSELMPIKIGLSRTQSSNPEIAVNQIGGDSIELRVYFLFNIICGAIAAVCLLVSFAMFASTTTLLRDTDFTFREQAEEERRIAKEMLDTKEGQLRQANAASNKEKITAAQAEANDAKIKYDAAEEALKNPTANNDHAVGVYSLARTQMALWIGLCAAGFMFLWLTLGVYEKVITPGILVLLGISSAAALTAILIDIPKAGDRVEKVKSAGFLNDLISDSSGPQLHRIQMVIWTCILATIFVWNVLANYAFVNFEPNLLLLMGVAGSAYLGFKVKEVPAKKDP